MSGERPKHGSEQCANSHLVGNHHATSCADALVNLFEVARGQLHVASYALQRFSNKGRHAHVTAGVRVEFTTISRVDAWLSAFVQLVKNKPS